MLYNKKKSRTWDDVSCKWKLKGYMVHFIEAWMVCKVISIYLWFTLILKFSLNPVQYELSKNNPAWFLCLLAHVCLGFFFFTNPTSTTSDIPFLELLQCWWYSLFLSLLPLVRTWVPSSLSLTGGESLLCYIPHGFLTLWSWY